MRRNRWKSGDWLAICDRCGFTYYASELRREWNGLMVCPEDYEPRHPQDFLKSRSDDQTVPWTRPDPDPTYVTEVTLGGINPMTREIVTGAETDSTNATNILGVYARVTNTADLPYGTARYNTITNMHEDFDYIGVNDSGQHDVVMSIPFLIIDGTFEVA